MNAPSSSVPGYPDPDTLGDLQLLLQLGSAIPNNPMNPSNPAVQNALGASGVGVDMMPILHARSSCTTVENVSCAIGTTTTLIDTTATPGPGVIDQLFLVSSSFTGVRDAYFRIYIDGSATPISIQGHHFGTFTVNASPGKFQTNHLYMQQANGSAQLEIGCKYPIPFKTSIKIVYDTAQCIAATTIFSNIEYRLGVSLPYKFGFSGAGYDGRSIGVTPTQQGNRTVQFLALPSGRGISGFIAGFTLCANNPSVTTNPQRDTYLENNIVVYQGNQPRDGSVAPAYNSTGTEDFFKSNYYFNQGEGSYNDVFVSALHEGASLALCVHRDLLSSIRGLQFDDGCLFTWETGLAASPGVSVTNIDLFWGVWYYTFTN